ncbi:MAG: dienelactone hydrolase family protein [Pseudomonadota bacterium]
MVKSLNDGGTGKIYFESFNPYSYNHILEQRDNDKKTVVFGVLNIPESSEPQIGAIIYVHGSSGVLTKHERWLKAFNDMGVATFRLDSFKTRGVSSTVGSQLEVTSAMMTADAYNALKLLSTHPRIDKERIGIMGSSKGGAVTLVSAWEPIRRAMVDGKLKFAFHIALYPFCYGLESVQMTGAPILTLMGEKDDWTPAAPCVELTNSIKNAGYDANIILYPNAYHDFDSDTDPYYLENALNMTKCRAVIQSNGLAIEKTSGLRMDQPDQLEKVWETCATRGVNLGKNSNAKEKSMKEVKKFIATVFKLDAPINNLK